MGLVASQILNLILSSGQEGDTPEVAGLNGTFEQLGNSIGVALVGTIMLGVLTSSLTQRVETSPVIPEAAKPQVIETVDRSVELVSDAQVAAALEASGLGPTGQVAVQEVYSASRATAFRSGMGLLLLLAAIGLLFTPRLSGRRLVEPSPD
jgi:hypothetical protein